MWVLVMMFFTMLEEDNHAVLVMPGNLRKHPQGKVLIYSDIRPTQLVLSATKGLGQFQPAGCSAGSNDAAASWTSSAAQHEFEWNFVKTSTPRIKGFLRDQHKYRKYT